MKLLALAVTFVAATAFAQASAARETTPIPSGGTAANDTAIWIHPTDVTKSLVFGTDGQNANGLYSYGLDGGQRQVLGLGPTRAVDVRYGVRLGTGLTDVVLAVRMDGSFGLYAPDRDAGALTPLQLQLTPSGLSANAASLYFDPAGATVAILISDFSGNLRHYEAVDDGQGHLEPRFVRALMLGSAIEGIAADDRGGRLFLTLANRGLFVLSASKTGSTTPSLVDSIDAGRLAGAAGLALYFTADGGGYLIASASQTSTFPVYALSAGTPFVRSFTVIADGGLKGATNTRGIEVAPLSLGAPFGGGLFVAHDPLNVTGPNYKLVAWDAIARSGAPVLAIDNGFDPRSSHAFDAGSKCPLPNADGGDLDGGQSDGGPGDCVSGGTGGGKGGGTTSPPIGYPSGSGGAGDQGNHPCGCGQSGLLAPLAALAWLLRRRRRPLADGRTDPYRRLSI